jgi:hypothetical protein
MTRVASDSPFLVGRPVYSFGSVIVGDPEVLALDIPRGHAPRKTPRVRRAQSTDSIRLDALSPANTLSRSVFLAESPSTSD